MFSYPLQVHPCRASIDAVLRWRPGKLSRAGAGGASSAQHSVPLLGGVKGIKSLKRSDMSETRFATITTIIIVLTYIVAMSVSSLEKVLAYVGSTGSTSISFILPGLFFYKISDPDSSNQQRLTKQDDDEDSEDAEPVDADAALLRPTTSWRKTWLRRASLALAIYGVVVMVVCLITNTFFIVAH